MTADDLAAARLPEPSHPLLVRELVFDDRELAHRARTTLAGADVAVLLSGSGHADRIAPVQVRIFDDEGEVFILCEPGSPIADEAEQRRLVTLLLEPTPTDGVHLTLHGRLAPVQSQPQTQQARPAFALAHRLARTDGAVVVALRVERVTAGCPESSLRSKLGGQRLIPLSLYALAEPDLIAANLPRIAGHLNAHHGAQLRDLVARTRGIDSGDVAVACLEAITTDGMTVTYVDSDGVSGFALRFAEQAMSVPAVLTALHELLRG